MGNHLRRKSVATIKRITGKSGHAARSHILIDARLTLRCRDEATLRTEIRRANDVCAVHRCQLIVNDYWRLAIEKGCDFVHLDHEDLAAADLLAIKYAGLKLGLSTHDHAELETALAAEPDYIALGPIYPTILKKMKWRPQGVERIGEWKRRVAPIPLVAIGGLNPDRLDGVFAAGADSAAVVTDITLNADPELRTREWIEKTDPSR
ncbi:thiamine phosphate synthase (plasmid) [Mesorhizobium loti]|nr:thiamine phosphate synthase [Mesorhizobium loti]